MRCFSQQDQPAVVDGRGVARHSASSLTMIMLPWCRQRRQGAARDEALHYHRRQQPSPVGDVERAMQVESGAVNEFGKSAYRVTFSKRFHCFMRVHSLAIMLFCDNVYLWITGANVSEGRRADFTDLGLPGAAAAACWRSAVSSAVHPHRWHPVSKKITVLYHRLSVCFFPVVRLSAVGPCAFPVAGGWCMHLERFNFTR